MSVKIIDMNKLALLYEKWCKIPDKIRFLIIGGVNAAVSYLIFAGAVFVLGGKFYQICVALQWGISSVFSFVNQKVFVFCTKGNWIKEYLKCCTTWLVSYVFNAIILELLVKELDMNVYLAQIISIFLVSILTYVLFKHFAFRRKNLADV